MNLYYNANGARTLLNAPITPFTVVFCHIIAHPFTTTADLSLLADFVATLTELRRFSDGMVKLSRLCDIFCKVATLYVRAKDKEASQRVDAGDPSLDWIGQSAVHDIDQYLSTIGFVPPPTSADSIRDGFGSNAEVDNSFLIDWYDGNSSLMGFLEQDLTFPGHTNYGYVPGQSRWC